MDIRNKIASLVEKYKDNINFYHSPHFNETELRNQFLDPLFEALGWDIRNVSRNKTNEREVLLEESLKANASTHSKKPDYTFRLYGERKFFLEAKKPCVRIDKEDDPAKQVRRYGYTAGLKISVLSNFEYLYIYDTTSPILESDTRNTSLIYSLHYTEYEANINNLLRYLGKNAVYSGEFDKTWADIEQNVEHQSVDNLFLEQINAWRLLLATEIHKADPSMGLEEMGDAVQSYINKILFLRVCEDRNIETYQRLLNIADQDSHIELVNKFREADTRYNSGLFKELLSEKIIGDISSSFWTIIRQLYFPQSPYSFVVLSSDILGRIYEIFLAEKLTVIGETLVIVKKPENTERDIVTTPNYIVREILNKTATELIKNRGEEELLKLKFADIACGSGVFLLELFQLLCDTLVDYYLVHDPSQLSQTDIHTYKLPYNKKKALLSHCIYGVDKDYNAVEACKFGLLLKLLEDEDVNSLIGEHPILPDMNGNICFGNSLLSFADIDAEDVETVNPFDFKGDGFDLIVGNPPYMKTEDIKRFTPIEKKYYEKKYYVSYKQYDKYFLFVERAMGLLKPNGVLGYILPSKFMKVGAAAKLRRFVTKPENQYLKELTSFGAHQVFSDKSTYTCLIVLEKKQHDEFHYTEVDDFTGWRVRDKDACEYGIRKMSAIGEDTWALCSDATQRLFNVIYNQSQPLSSIVGEEYIFNGIQTSASKIYVLTPIAEDRTTYTFMAFNGEKYQIEKAMTKPFFKTMLGTDALNSYRTFKPNARVVFPYKKGRDGKVRLIPLNTIQKRYPLLYKFLLAAKSELAKPSRNIQPKPTSDKEWHRYGRSQSLDACECKDKIIVGVLSTGGKYAVDNKRTVVASGGTAGYCVIAIPETCNYSIYYIQAILGSLQGEWMASIYGEIFRGGYIARGTKVLKKMPIRSIDFLCDADAKAHDEIVARQKRLILLGDKIASCRENQRKKIPLERQKALLMAEQQRAINNLYGMTEEEASLIPKIKDLYAAD